MPTRWRRRRVRRVERNPWEPVRFAHPWFARVADLVSRVAQETDWPTVATINESLGEELARVGVRLVETEKERPVVGSDGLIDVMSLYEVRIVERGEIPTRPRNLHDLLNALVWAAFPHSKLALSRSLAALQRERAAGRATLPNARTPAHDRLALVDEGALLCVASTTWIFGHALYEHAYKGSVDVRGIAIDLEVPRLAELDPVAARAELDRTFAAADLARTVRRGPGISVST